MLRNVAGKNPSFLEEAADIVAHSYLLFNLRILFAAVHIGQLRNLRPASLFTEADTFGKYLAFAFLFLLPSAFYRKKRLHSLVLGLACVTTIITMTRSAWLCLETGLIFYVFFHFAYGHYDTIDG